MRKTFVLGLATVLSLTTSVTLEAKPFAATDLMKFDSIHSGAVAPNGNALIYGLEQSTSSGIISNLYLKDLVDLGADVVQLTSHQGTERDVVWANDSQSVYFIANRQGLAQVWKLKLSGGEAIAVTDLPVAVRSFTLSPDNTKIALTLPTFEQCRDIVCNAAQLASLEQPLVDNSKPSGLKIRSGSHNEQQLSYHIYVGDLIATTVANLIDLNQPSAIDGATSNFLVNDDFTFTPDSHHLVYSAKFDKRNQASQNNYDLWQVPVLGGQAKNLTADNSGRDLKPVFSADGRYMAYLAENYLNSGAERLSIILVDLVTAKVKEVAPLWDRSVRSLRFASDSRNLFVTARDLGQVAVFVVNLQFGDIKTVYSDGETTIVGVSRDNLIVLNNDLSHPNEFYSLNRDSGVLTPLTAINKAHSSTLEFGDFSQFSFKGWNDESVYGYWIKPVNYRPNKKYPLALLIHDGPHDSQANSFYNQWQPQMWAGAGYGVVMIDFHGSIGYGQQFAASVTGDWGGKPLEDLQKGLASVTAQQQWLDGGNACALGSGYGGYLVNWIAGQWGTQFKCLINLAGMFDLRMLYQLSDRQWQPRHEFGGTYLEATENYENFNPANYVNNWTTPMLLAHGQLDATVPMVQSLATFKALQRKAIPVKLLTFSDEGHQILKPENRLAWYQQLLSWADKFTKSPASAK